MLLASQAFALTASAAFDAPPVLLTQIQTMANETANVPAEPSRPWLTVAVDGVSENGFRMALERSESAPGQISSAERVGFAAITAGQDSSFVDAGGNTIRFATQITETNIGGWNNGCVSTDFPRSYAQPPLTIASKISRFGGDGGWLRRCSLSAGAIGLTVDEDIAADGERAHILETASVLSVSAPFVLNRGAGFAMQGGRAVLNDTLRATRDFTDVSFAEAFAAAPVVFALTTSAGGDPAAVRVRNITTTGFQIAQVEPEGNDGPHISMTVDYLAVTPGDHTLANGTRLIVGTRDVTASQHGSNISNPRSWSSADFETDGPDDTPPQARFSTNVSDGEAPLDVNFDAAASSDDNGIALYSWDFGDGSSSSRPDAVTVSHQYTTVGDYTAELTVTDTAGATATARQSISVREPVGNDQPPTARFTTSTSSGVVPLDVQFDASSSSDDNGIAGVSWNFGDGNSATGTQTSHRFTGVGRFSVVVTVTDSAGQTDNATRVIEVRAAGGGGITDIDAARFLTQATFGTTTPAIAELKQLGYASWLDQQFAASNDRFLPYVQANSNGSGRGPRHNLFWLQAVRGNDQLRQRLAFALSQIFVVSDIAYTLGNAQYGMANYWDLMRDHAFGNYRDLLEDVTLNPIMGLWLSHVQNEKADPSRNIRPDENFAREILQLFTIGLHEMDQDGRIRLDASGNPIPTYDQQTVQEFARVFTGWHFASAASWNEIFYGQDRINPMRSFEAFHDRGAKTLLRGQTIPGGLNAPQDIDRALDNIFAHPNVPPFVSKQLIQRLVTSNPTPAYVRRIADVFADNGSGVRGDLRAVTRAILLDDEARTGHLNVENFGKLREPVLRLSHVFRAFSLSPGRESTNGVFNTASPSLPLFDSDSGQAVLRAKSVFNFYHPDYSPLGPVKDAGLVAPEFEIASENNVIATTSRIAKQIQYYFSGSDDNALNQSVIDIEREIAMAGDTDRLLDHLDVLLMSGAMTPQLRAILAGHINALPTDQDGRSQRARDAITLIVSSPEYLVQM